MPDGLGHKDLENNLLILFAPLGASVGCGVMYSIGFVLLCRDILPPPANAPAAPAPSPWWVPWQGEGVEGNRPTEVQSINALDDSTALSLYRDIPLHPPISLPSPLVVYPPQKFRQEGVAMAMS